jgi:asparagine synthase (glutamine-hydrolysing)
MDRADRNDLNQLLYTDIKTYLVDDILTKVDRASMAVSLEVRPPLLDHTFVEFAHRIRPSMKLQGGQTKAVFKSAMRPYLDQETLFRPKQGFTPPIDEWMRGPLRCMMADLLLSQHAAHPQYLKHASVKKALQEHQAGARNHGRLLWMVLMFELWARKFLLAPSPL